MKYEFWQHDPVPIWGVETEQDAKFDPVVEPLLNLMVAHKGVTMRGVAIDRLPTILSTGIDVDPTDRVIYCEIGDKAYEYGGFPKVVMVLRYRDDIRRAGPVSRLHDRVPELVARVGRSGTHAVPVRGQH